MSCLFKLFTCIILLAFTVSAATKPHAVTLGRWTSISLLGQDGDGPPFPLKIRSLNVDGHIKEFTLGTAHDVTDRTFVVQRIYRVNDSLPQQTGPANWQWQRGGWLLVDRLTGKIQQIALPEFDPDSSAVNWFRDYAAYCGVSDDGRKLLAMIMQLGRRKPLLKEALGDAPESQSGCAAPVWERNPVRVSFEPRSGEKLMFSVKKRAVDAVTPDESDGGE